MPVNFLNLSGLDVLDFKETDTEYHVKATPAAFDTFFARSDLVWADPSKNVVELAAAIRGQTGLRTPDALQAASCLQLGSDHLFLTGDSAFKRVADLNVKMLT